MSKMRVTSFAPPWLPNPEVAVTSVFHAYDRPLTGVISQDDGGLFVFHCVANHYEDPSVWVYIPMTETEVKDFHDAPSLDEAVERAAIGKDITAALSDDRGLVISVTFGFEGGDTLDLAKASVTEVLMAIQDLGDELRAGTEEIFA